MEKAPNSPEKTALHQCQTLIFWQERWAFRSTRSERSRNRRYDGKDESWDWHGHEDVQTRGLMLGPVGLWMRSLLIWFDAGPHAHVRGWYGDYGCPRGRQWLHAVLQVLSTARSFQSESFEILLSFQSWASKIEIYCPGKKRSQADSIGLESERCFNFSHLCISTVPSPVVAKKCCDESPFLPLIL